MACFKAAAARWQAYGLGLRSGTPVAAVTYAIQPLFPAGGLVEMQYAITVDLEVLDEHARPPPPPPDEQVCAVRFAPRLRRDESGGWRRDGEDVRMTEAALP